MAKFFEGVYSAIFSVYDENMRVKSDTVASLVDYQLDGGVKGFYVCGNTGECSVLPNKTRIEMLDAVVRANSGRGRIMAHIGASHFDDVMELIEDANGRNIDAISSLPPALKKYYNADEAFEYYKRVAKESRHPVYAYITPDLGTDPLAFARKLSTVDNIQGIKLTIPDYYTFGNIMAEFKGKLNVLNGPDETLVCGLSIGADGAIGTTYNILPKVGVKIYESFMSGNIKAALENQQRLNSFIKIPLGRNLSYWKATLGFLGFDMGHTVFPCNMPTAGELAEMRKALEQINFFDMV